MTSTTTRTGTPPAVSTAPGLPSVAVKVSPASASPIASVPLKVVLLVVSSVAFGAAPRLSPLVRPPA